MTQEWPWHLDMHVAGASSATCEGTRYYYKPSEPPTCDTGTSKSTGIVDFIVAPKHIAAHDRRTPSAHAATRPLDTVPPQW